MLSQILPAVGPGVAIVSGIVLALLLRGGFGRAVLQGLERLQKGLAQLAHKSLHPEELVDQGKEALPPTPAGEIAEETALLTPKTQDQQEGTGSGSEVFMILTRLVALILAIDVLLAIYIIDASRVPLVVFDSTSTTGVLHVPFSIPTVMGLLSWAFATLEGAFLFEVFSVLPPSAEFLPPWWRRTRAARIFFRVVIAVSNLLLLGYIALLGLVASLKLQHISWLAGSVIVSELQIILAHSTGLFSLWLLVLGAGAAVALVCRALWLVCAGVHLLLKPWVKPAPLLKVPQQPSLQPIWNGPGAAPVLKPGGVWPKGSGLQGDSEQQAIKEIPMKAQTTPHQAALIAAGTFGRHVLPAMLSVLPTVAGHSAFRSAAYIPIDRPPERSWHKGILHIGAQDASITPREHTTIRHRFDDEGKALLDRGHFKVQELTPKVAGHELILEALELGLVPSAYDSITRLARTLPRHKIALVVEATTTQLESPQGREALLQLAELHENGVVVTSLLFDPHGPITQQVVREKALQLLVRSLSGLVVSTRHHAQNPTGDKVLSELGRSFPFVGLSVGSCALPAGQRLSMFDPGRWASGSTRGRGDVEQTRHSLEFLAEELLTDESARLFPASFDPAQRPLVGEVFIPFGRADHRFSDVCDGLERWVSEEVPGASLVFVSGPGEPTEEVGNQYFGQWSWFYGMQLSELIAPALLPVPESVSSFSPTNPLPGGRTGGRTRRKLTTPVPAAGDGQQKPAKRGRRTPLRA